MAVQITDDEIRRLISESKPLPADYLHRIRVKPKRGHKERELEIKGADGHDFVLILRQSLANELDFSVILAYRPANTNQPLRIRRYNGKSHDHTNQLERATFYDFHIHTATERYQNSGLREDSFAEATDRFADLHGAVRCMLLDCGFVIPAEPQERLFGEEF